MTTITDLADELGTTPGDLAAIIDSDPTGTDYGPAIARTFPTPEGVRFDQELTVEGIETLRSQVEATR